jgi:hypothetical protein
MRKREVIDRDYISVSFEKTVIDDFGEKGDLIFRSPKLLFEFLKKIDFSKYYILPITRTGILGDRIIVDKCMIISKIGSWDKKIHVEIVYVETNFKMKKKFSMICFNGAFFGKNFYCCRRSFFHRKTMIIIFSHGVCASCMIDIYDENHTAIAPDISIYSPRKNIEEHIKDIIMAHN